MNCNKRRIYSGVCNFGRRRRSTVRYLGGSSIPQPQPEQRGNKKYARPNNQQQYHHHHHQPKHQTIRLLSSISSSSSMSSSLSSSAAPAPPAKQQQAIYGHMLTTRFPYVLPEWAKGKFTNIPQHGKLHLGNFPTPIYRLNNGGGTSTTSSSTSTSTSTTTIVQRLNEHGITMFVKRDDATHGCELTGNKIRKLELLLSDALAQQYTDFVTIGGEQSNHCRATACASRMVGLTPHLILRTGRANSILKDQQEKQQQQHAHKKMKTNHDDDKNDTKDDSPAVVMDAMGITGNILFDRMVGSTIYTCTPHEYVRVGSTQLLKRLCHYLENKQNEEEDLVGDDNTTATPKVAQPKKKKPYPIPVGGSNGLGTFGYLSAVDEILNQWQSIMSLPPNDDDQQSNSLSQPPPQSLDHVVVACGSGGTAGGIAIGMWLAYDKMILESQQQQNEEEGIPSIKRPVVHAIGVCDSPDYFYNHVSKIADEMGLVVPSNEESTESYIRKMFIVHSGKGRGYARSTNEELQFISSFAIETGIVLDPVYSGKAMYHFMNHVLLTDDGDDGLESSFRNTNILFIHTGGALGLYEQGPALFPTLSNVAPVNRLDLYGKQQETNDDGLSVDISDDVS